VVYALFEHLPFPLVLGVVFFGTAFLSYVSGADANATAMGGLSARGISPDNPEPAAWLKVAWGVLVGFTAWVMVSQAGVDGIKMASNLGGFPALLFLLGVGAGLLRLLVGSWKK
jgi:choline-glycine betaine transporter